MDVPDIIIYRDSTFRKSFRWKDKNGVPRSISGGKVVLVPGDGTVVIDITNAAGQDLPTAKIEGLLSNVQTKALTWEAGFLRVTFYESGSGDKRRMPEFIVQVRD